MGQDSNILKEHFIGREQATSEFTASRQVFKDGYIMPLGEDAPFLDFFGRIVPSGQLDASLVKAWLKICENIMLFECEDSSCTSTVEARKPELVFGP